MKILLVDDDAFLRDMYATKFTELGHEVMIAETGEKALELIQNNTFTVALMDMIMPGMTGVELLHEMRTRELGKNLKCIMLTNQGGKEEIEAALSAGALGYIVKAEFIPSEVVAQVIKLAS